MNRCVSYRCVVQVRGCGGIQVLGMLGMLGVLGVLGVLGARMAVPPASSSFLQHLFPSSLCGQCCSLHLLRLWPADLPACLQQAQPSSVLPQP